MKKNILFVGSALLLIALALVSWGKPWLDLTGKLGLTSTDTVDTATLKRQLAGINANYNADCQKMLDEFSLELEQKLAPEFARAQAGVPQAVENLSGFGTCLKLSYKAAKDKITGSNDFSKAYMSALQEPILEPCLQGNNAAVNLLQNLQHRLQERYTQYQTDVATVCCQGDLQMELPEAGLKQLETSLEKFACTTQEFQMKKNLALIGGVFEVVFIRQSCKCILKLFVKPVARICTTAGVTCVCAAADGPLPIGDVIGAVVTVGGLIWTAYDIYDISCTLPKQLRSELSAGVATTQVKLQEEANQIAKKLIVGYHAAGQKVNRQLTAQLD